jgi:SNF2 family DNA or RNA helicase
MEPCFNPALEAQAVGRVHRLGQKRSVDIVRLVMEESVEVRIPEMLEKKYGLNSAENNEDGNQDKKPAAKSAATPLVGSIMSDKAAVME